MGKKPLKSRVQEDLTCCLVCHRSPTQIHHVFYGYGRRKLSEKYGYIVALCLDHHTGDHGIHTNNKQLEMDLKRMCQEDFEAHIGSRDEFRKIFGKSYLGGGGLKKWR